jgi:hypothetical protein
MPNADGTCPTGSHKFPGSQVCEKDTTTPSSSGGGAQVPPECQGIIAGPSDKCSLGTTALPTSINGAPLTPQQQYEQCLQGIGGGIPGNCKPPTSTITEQNVAPLQTLTPQQTCQGGEVLDAKGDCVSPGVDSAIKNGTLIPLGNGKFKLATAPPVPNTNSIAPICPVGFHLALSKCVVNSGGCPSGTVQDDDICSPSQAHYNIPSNVAKLQDGNCPSGYHSTDVQCEINSQQKLPNGMCPDGLILTTEDKCVTMPVLPGTTTGSGGGFIQMIPQKTTPSSPPATSPNHDVTPPSQPSQPKQLTPTQTLTQQTCPPLPIDANGKCPGIDMRGGGLGLPPPPCESGYKADANGNCIDMRGGGLGLPPPPTQAHYNIPTNVAKLDDGSCPSRYHSNSDADQQCEIDSQPKLDDGRCPDGTILTTDEKCVLPPVLPGSTTGSGGGFIQMIPQKTG